MIINHDVIVIFPLGRFYQRSVFASPLFPKVNNGRPLLMAFDHHFPTSSLLVMNRGQNSRSCKTSCLSLKSHNLILHKTSNDMGYQYLCLLISYYILCSNNQIILFLKLMFLFIFGNLSSINIF